MALIPDLEKRRRTVVYKSISPYVSSPNKSLHNLLTDLCTNGPKSFRVSSAKKKVPKSHIPWIFNHFISHKRLYLSFAWYIFINVVAIWLNYNALYIIESLWMKLEIRSFLSKHWSLISTMPQFRVIRAMQHARVCIINAMRVRTIAITTAIILETGKITLLKYRENDTFLLLRKYKMKVA